MKYIIFALLPAFLFPAVRGQTGPGQIFICSSATASPTLQKAVTDFVAAGATVPLFKALSDAQDAGAIAAKNSEDLMQPAAYNVAAHNHLIVIGLLSQDALAAKMLGYNVTIDEAKKQIYAEGWGRLEGDIGYIESDRNPFLHSGRIKSAPEGTVMAIITGTSEKGILAALRAFQGGLLNGLVPVGPVKRVETTLLDQDALVDPAPFLLPATLPLTEGAATLAGWTQPGRDEYRNILEIGGTEPKRIWRYKYLAPHFLEDTPLQRWLAGINRKAFGNAVDVIEFGSPDAARQAAAKITAENFMPLAGLADAQEIPLPTGEVTPQSYWNIIVVPAGSYLVVSTVPSAATGQIVSAIK